MHSLFNRSLSWVNNIQDNYFNIFSFNEWNYLPFYSVSVWNFAFICSITIWNTNIYFFFYTKNLFPTTAVQNHAWFNQKTVWKIGDLKTKLTCAKYCTYMFGFVWLFPVTVAVAVATITSHVGDYNIKRVLIVLC